MNTEVITEKTGVIIPPKDEEALYIAMKNCILGRYDLSAMKRNCLNEAKKYDNKKFFPTFPPGSRITRLITTCSKKI
mgnify:CR=1 FL=1